MDQQPQEPASSSIDENNNKTSSASSSSATISQTRQNPAQVHYERFLQQEFYPVPKKDELTHYYNKHEAQLLHSLIDVPPNREAVFRCVYDAKQDGEADPETFRASVAGLSPTVCIVTTGQGWRFGGLSFHQWSAKINKERGDNCYVDTHAKLFRLKASGKYAPLVLPAVPTAEYHICDYKSYGPCFGYFPFDLRCFHHALKLGAKTSGFNSLNGISFAMPEDGPHALAGSKDEWTLAAFQYPHLVRVNSHQ